MTDLQPRVVLRKCRSAVFYARQWAKNTQQRRDAQRRRRRFRRWLSRLSSRSPDVLVGANFVPYGGTRHHMHSIVARSALDAVLIPDDEILQELAPQGFQREFQEEFFGYGPKNVKAVHSHVFPWFIQWCHHQQRQNGTRWVHTHHNWYYPEFAVGQLEPWQEEFNEGFLFALNHADVCLSVSRWQQAFLRETHGLQTRYLPNGVDTRLCDQARPSEFRRKTGLDSFVLYVGRNDPVKNPADFVRLATRLPQHQFVMIGQELSPDTLHADWGTPVPNNLLVLGGATHAQTQDAIAACSALVITSRREGLPTLVLEGMTHAKPVVVPDEDGCLEAIGHGDFGFIYPQHDIDRLASVTLEALSDRDRGIRARQRVLEEYAWPVVMSKLDRIYTGASAP